MLGYFWPKWLLDRNDVTYNKDDLELHDDEMGMFRDEECGKPKGVVRVERFKTAKLRKKEVISSSEAGASSAQVRDAFDNVRGKAGLNFKTSEDGHGKQQLRQLLGLVQRIGPAAQLPQPPPPPPAEEDNGADESCTVEEDA